MVVNSAPDPVQALRDEPGRTRRGRLWFFLVWIICAAPVVASYVTFYVIRPSSASSFGELITPQREMPSLTAQSLDGQTVALDALKGQWLLISVAGGACNDGCQKHLYLQRQLRELMGREKHRMDWVWLVNDAQELAPTILPALQSATVLRVADADLQEWLQASPGASLSDQLYVVDPLGRWMMRFPVGLDVANATKAKKDLARLLTASASWDKPGRANNGN